MAPPRKSLRTRVGRKAENRVPDELQLALLYLADICGRVEDGWTLPKKLEKTTLALARTLIHAELEEVETEFKRQKADLAKDLAQQYGRPQSEQQVAEVFERHFRWLSARELKLAVSPPAHVRAKGPKQCAAEVVEGLLAVSSRSIFNWQKLPPHPGRWASATLPFRQLLAFLRALHPKSPFGPVLGRNQRNLRMRARRQPVLRSIEAKVLGQLRKLEAAEQARR